MVAKPSLPDGVRAYNDVVYTTIKKTRFGDRDLHVDIFRPDDNKTYPALIMIHGGGWNSGDKSLQIPMAQQIASRGYVTIPVEYRLIPEALYPAGLHDIKTAVRWVRANAAQYGIDPERIAVSGCSAGAQLATLVGVTNGSKTHEGKGDWRKVSSDVQAVINMDGIATFVSESNIADARDRFNKKECCRSMPNGWEGFMKTLLITGKKPRHFYGLHRSQRRYALSVVGCLAIATVVTRSWQSMILWESTASVTESRSMSIRSGSFILGLIRPSTMPLHSLTGCLNRI